MQDFHLQSFGCDVYFETGTGQGFSLGFALESDCFTSLYSVEIDTGTYEAACSLFAAHTNLTLVNSGSPSALMQLLPAIPQENKILFFLDAHFPGEETTGFRGYDAERQKERRLPLENELQIIRDFRSGCRDIIIVDDLRIYENGPFESGNMPDWAETLSPEEKNIDFVFRMFPDKRIERYYRREGYLVIG